MAAPVYIPTNSVLGFSFLHILTNTCCLLICLWWPFWPVWSGWYIMVVLICISLMASRADHPFICLWALFMSSMVKCVFRSFAHFLNWVVCLSGAESYEFFIYFGDQSLVWGIICKYVFPYAWFSFHFNIVFFSHAETFYFDEVPPTCLFFPLCLLL